MGHHELQRRRKSTEIRRLSEQTTKLYKSQEKYHLCVGSTPTSGNVEGPVSMALVVERDEKKTTLTLQEK